MECTQAWQGGAMRAVAGGKWQATATGTCNDDCGKLTITVTYEKLLQEGGHSFGARLLVGAGCSLYGRKPTSRNRSLTQKLDASSTPCWQRLADASLRRWRTPGSGCESRPRDRVWVQRPLMRWRLSEQVLEWRRWLPWRTGLRCLHGPALGERLR